MAESVDALVSNTSGATRAGSTPALGTIKYKVLQKQSAVSQKLTAFLFYTRFVLVQHWCNNYEFCSLYSFIHSIGIPLQ